MYFMQNEESADMLESLKDLKYKVQHHTQCVERYTEEKTKSSVKTQKTEYLLF